MSFSVNKYNRILALLLCLAMFFPVIASSAETETDTSFVLEDDLLEEEVSEYCNLNYEEFASSAAGKLYVHQKSGRFYFEDTKGQRWYSNPDMADLDEGAGGVYRMELQSLLIIQYYEYSSDQHKKANTETSCVRSGGSTTVKKLDNGFEVLYDFARIGFKIPLTITLTDTGISAEVNCDEIVEKDASENMLCSISVLPYFGAGAPDEEGYIMISDGSGAIMNFNNGSYTKLGYSSHTYGRDLSKYHISRPTDTYKITMPVFGIKKGSSAFCAYITEGAAQSTFYCFPNGSITSYANVYTAFDLRENDIVVLTDSSNKQATVYQEGDMSLSKISITYTSLVGEDADYNGMARTYKNYLVERDDLIVGSQSMGDVAIDFHCSVKKKRSILGFPVTVNAPLSKLESISSYVDRLTSDGIDGFSITLRDWSREQLGGKIDYSMKPVSAIGNKGDMKSLSEKISSLGGSLNLSVKLNSFQKSGRGYFTWFDSAKSLSNSPIYNYEFFVSNSAKNKSAGRTTFLNPSLIEKMAKRVLDRKNKFYDTAGVSLGDTSTTLYSDFNKDNILNLVHTADYVKKSAGVFGSVAADFPADYLIKYTSLAQKLPSCSSKSDIFDKDIPFVQLVLSGIIPYTCEPVNLAANPSTALLDAAAMGSRIQYDLITEDAYNVVGTTKTNLYNAQADLLFDEIKKYSKHFKDLSNSIGNGYMIEYTSDGNLSETVYSNGTKVLVDRNNATVKVSGADKGDFSFSLN